MEYLHQTKMKEEIAEEVKKCHFCDKEFPQNTLDQHFVLHHLNVNTCPNCKFFANSIEVLMMHLKNFHENQKTQPMEEIITDEQQWIVESEINSILNNLTEENIEDMETKYSGINSQLVEIIMVCKGGKSYFQDILKRFLPKSKKEIGQF